MAQKSARHGPRVGLGLHRCKAMRHMDLYRPSASVCHVRWVRSEQELVGGCAHARLVILAHLVILANQIKLQAQAE